MFCHIDGMKWNNQTTATDSERQPIERIGFDMLRAIVTTRQALSPTARLVAALQADTSGSPEQIAPSPIAVLASCAVSQAGGAFFHAPRGPSDHFRRSGKI